MWLWIIFYVVMSFIMSAIILVVSFIWPVLQGAPFIATDRKKIADIISLTDPKAGQKIVDLGSGDGRLVLNLAKSGAIVHGYEINPILVWWSRYKIKKSRQMNCQIYRQDFWQKDLSEYNSIIVFGIGTIMSRLAEKFDRELRPGTKIISNGFTLPGKKEIKKIGQVYLYIR